MAHYTTIGDERLYTVSDFFYDSITDDAMLGIADANTSLWDGNGRFHPNIRLTIPDQPATPVFNEDPLPADFMALKNDIDGPVEKPTPAAVGFTTNTNPRNGGRIEESQAVRWGIVDAILSYRPERWMRPAYGTKLIETVRLPATDDIPTLFNSAASQALAPYDDRFLVESITSRIVTEFDEEDRLIKYLDGTVDVQLRFSNERIRVPIRIGLS